jgi:SAM-dependent methyltransferase
MAKFVCNICGAGNAWSGEAFEREKRSCASCGSNQRERGLLGALAVELFGTRLALPHFPRVKSWRGLGTSDSPSYANRLAQVFDYRNTFFDRAPRLDLARLDPSDAAQAPEQYDFIVSSEVFEHVAPPLEAAFHNAWALLKPGGVLVMTVPYHLDPAVEHFPDPGEFGLADVGGRIVLVSRAKTGEVQVHEDLSFHLSGSGPSLEMRICSEESLRAALSDAGFSSVRIHAESYRPFGIVPAESWALPISARKGTYACSIDAMRDVIEEWRALRSSLAGSKAYRIARKLGMV